jgi:ribosome-binding factor A
MSSRRALKTAAAIREVVSMAILAELRDPRVRNVTVTFVEVSADLRNAKVHVSVMGDETQQKLSLHGLQNAAGFLQAKIAKGVEMRYTPRLTFFLDQGVKKSIEVAEILRRVLPPAPAADEPAVAEEEAEEPLAETDDAAAPTPPEAPEQH